MKLQGLNLSLRMQGADAALLQEELRQLSFSINNSEGFFGKITRQEFQAAR
jgi:hypothetical protein